MIEKRGVDANIIAWVCCFFYLLIPTSLNAQIFGSWYDLLKWIIAFILVCFLASGNRIDKNRFCLALIAIAYMSIVTLIACIKFGSRFSFARVVPIVCVLMMLSIDVKQTIKTNMANQLTRFVMILTIIFGVGMIVHFSPIGNYLINLYSQSYDSCVPNAVEKGRPVFTLGVYTRTAFFYMLFFYYYYNKARMSNDKRYLIGCVIYFLHCVFLVSNSSLVYSAIMFLLLLWLLKGKPIYLVVVFILLLVAVCSSYDYLLVMYQKAMASNTNGLASRYGNGFLLYQRNIEIIKTSLGLGFTILKDVVFADSGWLQFLTMGNVPLVVVMYYMLLKSIKHNFKSDHLMIFAMIMSFEFVESGMWYDKFVFSYILLILLIGSKNRIEKEDEIYGNNELL